MQYSGGKEYLIKRHGFGVALAGQVNPAPLRIFDLGHGSGAPLVQFAKLAPSTELFGNDLHPAAHCLMRSVAGGWQPPETLSEEEHCAIRDRALASSARCSGCQYKGPYPGPSRLHTCDAAQDPLVGFAGFCCNFGGMYFAGYARPRPATPTPVAGQRKVLIRDAPHLARVCAWHCADYREIIGPPDAGCIYTATPGDLVYFDKPYEGTTGYSGVPAFDHTACWAWLERLAAVPGVRVLVSEFAAPPPWRQVWAVERAQESKYSKAGGAQRVAPRVDALWTV